MCAITLRESIAQPGANNAEQKEQVPLFARRSVYLAVKLWKKEDPEDLAYSLIRIPGRSVPRFLVLPEENGKQFVLFLDDIIRFCMADIFFYFDYDMYGAYTIKITRDAELDLDDDISKSFVEKMSHSRQKSEKKESRFVYFMTGNAR